MECILIHKPIGYLPQEVMKSTLEQSKKMLANLQAYVPGGKLVCSYYAVTAQEIFCAWEIPNVESIAPMLKQMSMMGWNTEFIPVEKSEVAMMNMEKMMREMQAPAMAR